ncbi:hypothetical protein JAAARDRAFT_166933 [Jaapia argillacea MUCL 33604]|uniref:Mediator of RNA polymerase II transcription subunit 17 n=1 Tax=Jaapia argillacea MUCL 33604 TaxID=933084 RepID=A0A067QEF1_9AGAM|nr:hypothetical protein JAAARDRAFT_166933 [Jaapia argillacea MUCL 33604]
MDDLPWKQLKLSLERPYKNDNGDHIPVLLDITPEGQHVYEPREDPAKTLGERLRRIFLERGVDFFDHDPSRLSGGHGLTEEPQEAIEDTFEQEESPNETPSNQPMTSEELFKMRMELMPQLYIALGEMSHARDLLALLLSSPLPAQQPPAQTALPAPTLSASVVTKPSPIPSVQGFNAQLTVGGKDDALRKAASLFTGAADSIERGRVRGDQYWLDALRIRRGNWGLIPAPLPFGAPTGKGADKTSKDFLVTFGLEESSPGFRRRAIGHMITYEATSGSLVFPHRQRTRLRICINTIDDFGQRSSSENFIRTEASETLDGELRAAQTEVVEQEIFSFLIREAGNLPTASARVSERLIVIEAAQGSELRFELVDNDSVESLQPRRDQNGAKCDLVYAILHVLLLRAHSHAKSARLGTASAVRTAGPSVSSSPPPLLQPIIDILQYEVFCKRVQDEINKLAQGLIGAGVPCKVRFNQVGESGETLVKLLDGDGLRSVSGQAVVRIDERDTIRFTFASPSSLTAHLPQATISISSIPQLCQLLADEVERCLLGRICDVGTEMCSSVNGIWFVDLVAGRSVGRWEGCVLNFRVSFGEGFTIMCSAFRLDSSDGHPGGIVATYNAKERPGLLLLAWVRETISMSLGR